MSKNKPRMSKNKPRNSYVENSNLPPCNFFSRTNHSAMNALILQKQATIKKATYAKKLAIRCRRRDTKYKKTQLCMQ